MRKQNNMQVLNVYFVDVDLLGLETICVSYCVTVLVIFFFLIAEQPLLFSFFFNIKNKKQLKKKHGSPFYIKLS